MLRAFGRNVFVRFFIPVFISFFIFISIIFGYLIPRFEEEIIKHKKEQCRDYVHIACSFIQKIYDLNQAGELTTELAQQRALYYLKSLRYGSSDIDYFWIHGSNGRAVMHPYLDDFDLNPVNKITLEMFEKTAKRLSEAVRDGNGEAYVNYEWPSKTEKDKMEKKLSYIKIFKPWGWEIGTGIYLNEEKKAIASLIRNQIYTCVAALILILLISLFIIYQAGKSERKLISANQEIEIRERKYRDLFEKSADAMFIFGEDCCPIDCNDACVRMFGYDNKSDVMRQPGLLSPEFQQDGQNSYEKAEVLIKQVARERKTMSFEWIHMHKDGTIFPVDVTQNAVELENGQVFIHATVKDITERKENERKIKEYQEHLEELVRERTAELEKANLSLNTELAIHKKLENDIRQILDSAGDAMRVVAVNHDVLYANRRFAEITGIPKDRIVGVKCTEHFPDENCNTPNCEISIIVREKKAFEREVAKKMPDGRVLTFIQTCAPYLTPEGEIVGVVENFKDITERKKVEEIERQAAVQRGRIDMSNNILHDIGNAITSIGTSSVKISSEQEWDEFHSLGQLKKFLKAREEALIPVMGEEKTSYLLKYIELLAENLKNRATRYREIFTKVTKSVSHINSILDLQRSYAKGSIVTDGKLDLIKLIGDALFMVSSSFEKRNIIIRSDISVRTATISGDHTRMLQVFINILKNACEAFDESEKPEGDARYLKISISRNDDKFRIEIEDNAIGFEPGMGEKFFSKGFTTKSRDSGLGLHECRSIVESHNGSIRMESGGKGTYARVVIILDAENNKIKS